MRDKFRNWASIQIALVGLCLGATVWAGTTDASAYLDSLRTDMNYPGISAAIAIDGNIVWADASGFSNVDSGVEAAPQTVYRLGSVSKMLTIAAVVKLHQEGKLDLDAPIQHYVPEFPEKDKGPITTRLLAGHLAGMPHYMAGDKPDTARPDYANVIDAIAEYRDKPQLSAPGTRFHYSTYGYSLISAVVERAAGRPFPDYLHEAIAVPLGLTRTRVERAGESVDGIATFYERTGAREIGVLAPMYVSYKWAGGGMLSTVEDLVRFGDAWLPGSDFFSEDALALTFTSQKTTAGEATGTGLGWRIDNAPDSTRVLYHHGGAIDGGRAFIAILPGERTVVAILANMLGARNFDQIHALAIVDALKK